MKKIYKSNTNRIFFGLLGGLGDYFNIDPTLLRLVWILVTIFTGFVPGMLAYVIASMVVPKYRL
ncbi:MAG: PspC domain-containing protein [bacterium]|nr:PspC domain-containing protein [bacterium]